MGSFLMIPDDPTPTLSSSGILLDNLLGLHCVACIIHSRKDDGLNATFRVRLLGSHENSSEKVLTRRYTGMFVVCRYHAN